MGAHPKTDAAPRACLPARSTHLILHLPLPSRRLPLPGDWQHWQCRPVASGRSSLFWPFWLLPNHPLFVANDNGILRIRHRRLIITQLLERHAVFAATVLHEMSVAGSQKGGQRFRYTHPLRSLSSSTIHPPARVKSVLFLSLPLFPLLPPPESPPIFRLSPPFFSASTAAEQWVVSI